MMTLLDTWKNITRKLKVITMTHIKTKAMEMFIYSPSNIHTLEFNELLAFILVSDEMTDTRWKN